MTRLLSRAAPALGLAAGLATGLSAALAPGRLAAQGTLSVQGFGYPTGQYSTRALGTGGALGEFDPVTPLNPVSLLEFGRTFAAFQYDPEFRRLQAGGTTQSNTISRFPIVAVGAPFRRRYMFGVSASTLLDRSFQAEYRDTTRFSDGALAGATERVESNGSIADIRLAAAYQASRWLRVGLSGHLLSGENRLVSARQFDDSVNFSRVNDSTTISYAGTAFTLGAEVIPVRGVRVAGSYRLGGALDVARNDSTLTEADGPSRAGVALRVDRVTGAVFALGYSRTAWSRMRGLGTDSLQVADADEITGGVEAVGPRLGDFPLLLRVGARRRTLPFGVAGARVRETSVGGGFGLPLGGGRAVADVAVQRAVRTPEGGSSAQVRAARERAFLLSLGVTVRP